MKVTVRAAAPAERLYSQPQSQQISMQTGCVGHMQINMTTGDTTWTDAYGSPKTAAMESELESLISDLREKQFVVPLEGIRGTISAEYCTTRRLGGVWQVPRPISGNSFAGNLLEQEGPPQNQRFCGVGTTEQYVYLISWNPVQEGYQISCYRRDWLEQHMKRAEKGIRFITPDYQERFRIPDGDKIRMITDNGDVYDHVARYIDDTHLEVGNSLYHICEFAERMERSGNTVIPLRSSLPEKCFSVLPGSDTLIVIKKGEMGYHPAGAIPEGITVQEGADAANKVMGVTKAQESAMLAGSMFGWGVPAADPKNYDEQGRAIKPKHRSRDDAR